MSPLGEAEPADISLWAGDDGSAGEGEEWGECRENRGELACVGAPQGAAQRHSSTLS